MLCEPLCILGHLVYQRTNHFPASSFLTMHHVDSIIICSSLWYIAGTSNPNELLIYNIQCSLLQTGKV